jgi:threonine dehydrogenase-like Zn-dependent dehydrogenase
MPGASPSATILEPFYRGLHELGYVEGQNIAIERRYADSIVERLPDLAAELVKLKVDIIVAWSTPPALAAKQATSTIPGAHKTLEASSAPDARVAAVRAVRAWGTACFVGERGQVTLDVSPDLLRRQVTLVGSWTFSKQGQAECAEFVADRRVDVERLFTHRWKLEQAEEAYRLFDTQTTGKAVILPS